jgi:uncharacterized membrane protein
MGDPGSATRPAGRTALIVAGLGLAYYLAMAVLLLPAGWAAPRLDQVRVAAAVLGAVTVIYLIWIELFRVDAICPWCTAVHVCTIALLATTLWHTSVLRGATAGT